MHRIFGISVYGAIVSVMSITVTSIILWMHVTQRQGNTPNTWVLIILATFICIGLVLYILFGIYNAHVMLLIGFEGIMIYYFGLKRGMIAWDDVDVYVKWNPRGKKSILIKCKRIESEIGEKKCLTGINICYTKQKLKILLTYMLAYQNDASITQQIFTEKERLCIKNDADMLRRTNKHY